MGNFSHVVKVILLDGFLVVILCKGPFDQPPYGQLHFGKNTVSIQSAPAGKPPAADFLFLASIYCSGGFHASASLFPHGHCASKNLFFLSKARVAHFTKTGTQQLFCPCIDCMRSCQIVIQWMDYIHFATPKKPRNLAVFLCGVLTNFLVHAELLQI